MELFFLSALEENVTSPQCFGASTLSLWRTLWWKMKLARIYPFIQIKAFLFSVTLAALRVWVYWGSFQLFKYFFSSHLLFFFPPVCMDQQSKHSKTHSKAGSWDWFFCSSNQWFLVSTSNCSVRHFAGKELLSSHSWNCIRSYVYWFVLSFIKTVNWKSLNCTFRFSISNTIHEPQL